MANEKRLIDANALIGCFEKEYKQSTYPYFHIDEITDEIMTATTVDAVVVVRCRDCINYNTMGCSNGFGWCEAWQQGRANESFCDCGERKNNG